MSFIKCIVKFEDNILNIKVTDKCSVFDLQLKLRKFMKLNECEAVFLFFKVNSIFYKDKIYAQSKLLSDIQKELCMTVLHIDMLRENAFGKIH